MIAAFADSLLLLLGRRRSYRVEGDSMLPTLRPGDVVIVDPTARAKAGLREGDIAVARHPYRTDVWLVKRVARVLDGGRYLLAGDNPGESSDSRYFGAVPARHIVGPVVRRYA